MKFDEKTQKKIQQLQHYEQTLQSILMQKQAFQIEINEAQNALIEIKSSKDDVYKMVGQILIKADKEKVVKDFGRLASAKRCKNYMNGNLSPEL